jgi:hypothetical protein
MTHGGSEERQLFVCDCFDIQHQFIISHDKEIDMFFFQIHLSKLPFLKRVVVAFKYLFGFQSSIGAFEEVVLNTHYVKKLNSVLKEYIELGE